MQIANLLIYFAGILWGIELIPQLIKTCKTKNVEGVSLGFFITCLMAYLCYGTGNFLLKNWNILFAHVPSLLLNIWMLILILKYRKIK